PLPLHSFPTRRSSDLLVELDLLPRLCERRCNRPIPDARVAVPKLRNGARGAGGPALVPGEAVGVRLPEDEGRHARIGPAIEVGRSEEHTSELQSLAYL